MIQKLKQSVIPAKPSDLFEFTKCDNFCDSECICMHESVGVSLVPQLIHSGKLDFLVFDYLSEITMSLLTAAKAKMPVSRTC